MKKLISAMLVITLIFGGVVVGSVSAEAATEQEAIAWCESKVNTRVEYNDSANLYQCFDFVSQYAYSVFGYANFGTGLFHAKNLYDYNPGGGWIRIQSNADLKPGDIFVQTGGTSGHTGVIVRVSGDIIYTIDQNSWDASCNKEYGLTNKTDYAANQSAALGTGPRLVNVHKTTRSNINGVLRPPIDDYVTAAYSLGSDSFYGILKNPASGKLITNQNNNAALYAERKNGTQVFQFLRYANGTYRIFNPQSGLDLDVMNFGTGGGTRLQFASWVGNTAQQYRFESYGAGCLIGVQCAPKMVLDISGPSVDGANIQLWDRNNYANQIFSVIWVSPVTSLSFRQSSINISINETINIADYLSVSPTNAYNPIPIYTSSNTNIATVGANGLVVGKAQGSMTVTVKSQDGLNKTAAITVNVNPITETEDCAAMGHDNGAWATITEPICEVDGLKELKCTKCSATLSDEIIPATGHNYGEWTITKPASESEDGSRERICAFCNGKEIDIIQKLLHSHNYSSVITEPSCTSRGYTNYICDCGDSYEGNYIDATGHVFGNWVVTTPATETTAGIETRTCQNDPNHTETRIIPKLDNPDDSTCGCCDKHDHGNSFFDAIACFFCRILQFFKNLFG